MIRRTLLLERIYTRYKAEPALEHLRYKARFVAGQGNARPDVIFVLESPGLKDDEARLPLVGPPGLMFRHLLNEIGLERRDVFVTNLVKYRPPNNRGPSDTEREVSAPYLQHELRAVWSKVIVVFGPQGLQALVPGASWEEYRGHVLKDESGRVIIPSYHPALGLVDARNVTTLSEDFNTIGEFVWDQPQNQPDSNTYNGTLITSSTKE